MEVLRQLGRDQRDYEVEKCKLIYLSMYNNLNKMEVKFLYKNNNKMIKDKTIKRIEEIFGTWKFNSR